MSQHGYFHQSKAVADANGIALRALAAVVSDVTGQTDEALEADIQDKLLNALDDQDWANFDATVEDIVASGVSREDIANHYIPRVARILGQAWIDDQMEFASVSIGCARLQGYLRRKGLDWCATNGLSRPHVATVLLAVPDFEQHTLGATLLAGQLRAQGLCVVTEFHASPEEIESAAARQDFDAIMISSSRSETIALLCTIVLNLKNKSAKAPIIIGGNVLEQTPNVLAETGADFVANCWQDALGIIKPKDEMKEADIVGCRG